MKARSRSNSAAPINRREFSSARGGRDLRRLAPGAVITPQVIIVQRNQALADRNDAGAGRVERDGLHGVAGDACLRQRFRHRFGQRAKVIFVPLRCVIRVIPLAQ